MQYEKVYIKVTEALAGDPNVIETLERRGCSNISGHEAEGDTILYINKHGFISKVSLDMENSLLRDGYSEIFPDECKHTIHLDKGETSLLIPLKVPEGYEAVMNGEVVSEIELELRRKRWKPEKREDYFYVCFDSRAKDGTFVSRAIWEDTDGDRRNFEKHNVFRSVREAHAFLDVLDRYWFVAVEEYEKNV